MSPTTNSGEIEATTNAVSTVELTEDRSEEIEEKERLHFIKIISAFKNYSQDAKEKLQNIKMNGRKIPGSHQSLLEKYGFQSFLKNIENCIESNQKFISEIISDVESIFLNGIKEYEEAEVLNSKPSPMNIEKVHSTLKMFTRDWSEEGVLEREVCYGSILEALKKQFPEGGSRKNVSVLIPGAGLGRLAFEVVRLGFDTVGNEFSLFMLFASNFVLNKCGEINNFTIYPWVHSLSNTFNREDVIRPVTFPDVNPNSLPSDASFSMIAGDFLEVYGSDPSQEKRFDSVVTSFFLDCAHNIIDFISTIHKVLKPGGCWINFGPLLYHYSDIPGELSIEPPFDIVKNIIKDFGFEFQTIKSDMQVPYNQNLKSMLQYRYNCVFFICIKK